LSTASASGALRHRVESLALHSPVRNVVNDMAARQSVLKKRKISSVMMSAEGSDAKEKLTEMEEDPKKAGQWWEEKPDLEGRTKKEVKQWLQHFKQENELDFEVDDVACPGKLLAARTKAQLKDIAGKIAGIDIFNAKEELKKKGEKRKSISDYELESDTKGKRFKIDGRRRIFPSFERHSIHKRDCNAAGAHNEEHPRTWASC